jgi:hypothetical protein
MQFLFQATARPERKPPCHRSTYFLPLRVFHEGGRFGEPGYEVEYVAQLGKVDVDNLVTELKNEIQTLQDALDEFNFTRSVNA